MRVVVLDEIESIFQQILSMKTEKSDENFVKFLALIAHADTVVCMDANLTSNTQKIINDIFKLNNRAPTQSIYVNTFKPNNNYKYFFMENLDDTVSDILRAVEADKRVAIAITSVRKAKLMHKYFEAKFPSKKVNLYSRDTGDKSDFDNVNTTFQKLDILIYTPTLTAGVSFELKHFDCMYGIFDPESCPAESCS